MKKFITSAGLAALGAVSLQAGTYAPAPQLTQMETEKPWSVAVALRGFYDDNYITRPETDLNGNQLARESFGFQLTPSAGLNLTRDTTYVGLSYTYDLRYYDDRQSNRADHSHNFDARLNHTITDRYSVSLTDSFVIAQEPTLLDQGGVIAVPLRINGNNIRNRAEAAFKGQFTETFGAKASYGNNFYDYEADEPGANYSSLLDRIEHVIRLDGLWHVIPDTVLITGYQYGEFNHTSEDSLSSVGYVAPDIRDSRSHYFYVGAERSINEQLSVAARVGAQYTDYYNMPGSQDEWGPYADVSATYGYGEGCNIQLGVRHSRNQTDIAFPNQGVANLALLTLDQESTSVYGQINHQVTDHLVASVIGQYQNGSFNGGFADELTDSFFLVGLNLTYKLDEHWSFETGYNYDKLDSDLSGRGYDRNRVYLGVRAAY